MQRTRIGLSVGNCVATGVPEHVWVCQLGLRIIRAKPAVVTTL
jgi:hypothetical protein